MTESEEILTRGDRAHRLVTLLEQRRRALRVLRGPTRGFSRWWPRLAGGLMVFGIWSAATGARTASASLEALAVALEAEDLQAAAQTLNGLESGLQSVVTSGLVILGGLIGLFAWELRRRLDSVVCVLEGEGLLDEEPAEARAARAEHAAATDD